MKYSLEVGEHNVGKTTIFLLLTIANELAELNETMKKISGDE